MKPKKIAVTYDCGKDEFRNLETRISFVNDPILRECYIMAGTLTPKGETTGAVRMEVTPEIAKEICGIFMCEIFNNEKR